MHAGEMGEEIAERPPFLEREREQPARTTGIPSGGTESRPYERVYSKVPRYEPEVQTARAN